jgi:serine phosphatase RsbU (regulator of sigma subunit)/putative methionine-R-sulfoxide reductase with GAF domain
LADDESTSEELSADDQLDETLGGLLTALRDLFGGDAAALLLADAAGSELVTRAAIGFGPRVEAVHIAVGAGFAGSVMAGQRPVVVDDISGYEIVSPALRDSGLRSLMAVPLVTADRTLGVMHVGSRKLAHFAAEDAEDLLLIADRIAAALERSRLLSAERAARAAAESAHERLAFLSDATRVASSSLDRRQILDRVARLAVPRLADWCTVYVKVDDRIVRVALHTTDTSRTEIRHVRDTLDHALDGSSVVERIWETGAAVLVDDPAREARSTVGTRLEQLVDELGVASYMIVPVVTRGRTEAVMSFGVGTGRSRYSRDDLALAQELAGRVATGLANAALYEREHSVAESLTRAVLPERMPELPGLTVSARYRPAGANVDVGGDWYDAFALGDGRVGLVIGDVGGHGLPAASGMVQLRNGLRSYAILGLSPSEVLARTAEFMTASDLVAETIATVLYAVYDPVTGVLTWSSAGHPPPLFITHGQAKFLDTLPGPLLGVGAPAEYPEQNTQLEPGSGLILYTDGLVEQRDENIDIGFERLANAAKLLETIEPNSACAALIDELTGQADRDDDCCIMCVHRSP